MEEFGRKPQKGDIDGRREIAALYRAYAVQKEKEKAKETGKRRNYYRGYDPKSSIEVAIPQGSSVVQNPEPEGNIQTAGNEQMKLEFSPEKVEKERGFSSENAEIKQRINASEVELKPELGDCASLKSSEAPKVNFDSKSALESKDESMEHVGKNSSSSGIKKTKTQKRPNANVNESQGSSKKAKSSSDNSTKARKKKLSQATENYVKLNIRQKNFSCAHKIRKPVQSGLVRRKWLSKKEYFHQKRSFELKEINQTLYNELDDSLLHTIFEGTQTLQDDTVPEPKSHLSSAEQVLREIFGFQDFRPGQREVIDNLMNQQSSLLVLPTGQGKSLCYQIPAFLLNGLTLVITPLISLMQDQLKRLPKELSGAYWNSQMTSQESSLFFSDLLSGKFKVLPFHLNSSCILTCSHFAFK